MRYCVACQRTVRPVKHWSWPAFFLCTLIFIWVAGIWVYSLYYWLFKRPECPICRGKAFLKRPPEAETTTEA